MFSSLKLAGLATEAARAAVALSSSSGIGLLSKTDVGGSDFDFLFLISRHNRHGLTTGVEGRLFRPCTRTWLKDR